MQTKDRRGIICDLCGSTVRDKFTYYSGELHKVDVDKDKKQTVDVDRRFLDFDVCEECFKNKIKRLMLKVINEREKNPNKEEWS